MRNPLRTLQTLLVVTLVTVLVWLYAEGAIVKTYARQRVRLVFVPQGAATLAIEPASTTVYVNFRGSSSQHQTFEQITAADVAIEIAGDEGTSQRINIAQQLEQEVFNLVGADLESVTPEEVIDLRVRPLVEIEVPVEISAEGFSFATPPTPDPLAVRLTVPEPLADRARRIVLPLGPALRRDPAVPGTQDFRRLDVDIPPALDDPFTELLTPEVEVNFTLSDVEARATLSAVPLYTEAPLAFGYAVRARGDAKTLDDVVITGPQELIDRVLDPADPLTVNAEIRLHDISALSPGSRSVPVFFNTPPGITAPELRTITVELTPVDVAP